MTDIIIGGSTFVIEKLNARAAYDVVRRLGSSVAFFQQQVTEEHPPGARFLLGTVFNAMRDMAQADSDFILNTCLSAVRKRTAPGVPAVAIMNAATGRMMFDDIDMETMLELADAVIQESLGPFFAKQRAAQNQAASGEPSPEIRPTSLPN